MGRTLIQKYSSSIIRGFVERVNALSDLNHKLTKGELRELFVTSILESFFTNQFGIGSGIVINQKGEQSNQTDIIVYDNRVLPPFIKEQHIGVYPAECVLATIEVKSILNKKDLLMSETSANRLLKIIYNPLSSIDSRIDFPLPICAVIGFSGNGTKNLSNQDDGNIWLKNNIAALRFIGLLKKYSWINMGLTGWTRCEPDIETHEETKRFIAVLIDNVRTISELRDSVIRDHHKDWLGIYIREHDLFH